MKIKLFVFFKIFASFFASLFLSVFLCLPSHAATSTPPTFVRQITSAPVGGHVGYFKGPLGVAVDANGNIFVADQGNNRIQKFDSNGNLVTTWGSNGQGPGQFSWVNGVAVDTSTGNVYVLDPGNGRIQEFNNSGAFIRQWNQPADGWWITGIDVRNGRVYVVDQNNTFEVYDLSGNFIFETGADDLSFPNGITADPAGNIYLADSGNNRVVKYDSAGNYVSNFSTGGVSGIGIALDQTGNFYLSDQFDGTVEKFDSSGNHLTQLGTPGSGPAQFDTPAQICLDAAGNIYVADSYNYRIQEINSAGQYLTQIGSGSSADGGFFFPVTAAADQSGNLYVADTGNKRIQKFSSSGSFLLKWGTAGSGHSQFNDPRAIAVDNSGHVLVGDYSGRIQKFDSAGNFVSQWGSAGNLPGQLNVPIGIAFDSQGNIYTTERYNRRVQKFDSNGNYLTSWMINSASYIAIDENDNIFLAEILAPQKIYKYSVTGTLLSQWDIGSGEIKGLAYRTSTQSLLVSDYQHSMIKEYDTSGNLLTSWSNPGDQVGQFYPYGLAYSGGNVYIVDGDQNRVSIFSYNSSTPASDTTPPSISITSPTNGATIPYTSSTVIISATSTDETALAGVTFYLDGQAATSEITSSPFTYIWNTTTTSSGVHSFSAVARDSSNNFATSTISLTLQATPPPPSPPDPTPTPTPTPAPSPVSSAPLICNQIPVDGFKVSINNGAALTVGRKVLLTFNSYPGIKNIALSRTPDFISQIPFQSEIKWDLCGNSQDCSQGNYTVYAGFYDACGRLSATVSSTIFLKPPTVTISQVNAAPPKLIFNHDLKFGDNNPTVKLLQTRLRDLGYLSKKVVLVNHFGLATKKALLLFQKHNKLKQTGFLDKATRKLLSY